MLAQEMGSITGQVVDPTGAVVVGAQVAVTNEATNDPFVTETDTRGVYRAPQLRPAVYTISISAPGFSSVVRPGVIVRVDDRLRVDIALKLGTITEIVEVTGAPPLLQTEDATAGQVITNEKIRELPLNNRNWLQLASLAPATVTYQGATDLSGGNTQSLNQNVGGTGYRQTNFLLDGTDNTGFVIGGALVYPPVDSIQEFKVQTNNYTADTGRLGGSVVNATIKSGSNSFHGTAYDFLRNRALNGVNFFAPPGSNPQFTRNQFGASLGGPVVKDTLFFFFNYEGIPAL